VAGCDKATPVAPSGSILAISANPTKIALNGQSVITIIGRKPDGNPFNPGTEIRLSATLGSIPSIVTTDRDGNATAIFQSDGRFGMAMITAQTGGTTGGSTGGSGGSGGTGGTGGSGSSSGTGSASIQVEVGTAAKTIILQPTPTTISSTGGQVSLLAIVRDTNGQPLAGQGVNFSTDLGTLASRGAIVNTDSQGQARDILKVSANDLLNNATAVHVTVQSAGSDGALVNAMATIQVIGGRPVASFSYAPLADNHQVQFSNKSTGGSGTLTYIWDFGDGTSSSAQNPVHTYTANQQFTVTLTVSDSTGNSSVATATFTIPLTQGGNSQ